MKIGTRASALALAQSRWVAEQLRAAGVADVNLVEMVSSGDKEVHRPLAEIAGLGAFTREIELALLANEVDLAVHSLKDLPTTLPEGLTLAAVPVREDVRDTLITAGGLQLADLPAGARVGTSSQRRAAQILAMRPDVKCVEIRGNVPTRIQRVDEGAFDATLLALAGLRRLGLAHRASQIFEPAQILPAVGQGALGLETREGDAQTRSAVARLSDPDVYASVLAERSLLRALGGGCRMPLGAWGRVEGGRLKLDGCACSLDGKRVLRAAAEGAPGDAEALGLEVARQLEARGAKALLAESAAADARASS
jgi:hydroxymethylbilane synthase